MPDKQAIFEQESLQRLLSRMRKNRVVPFIGAGMSADLGYPGWSQFLLNEARKARKLTTVRHLIGKGLFEEAAECLANHNQAAFHRAVCNTFAVDKPPNVRAAAIFCLPRLIGRGPVITTNFDHVLEHVYGDAAGMKFDRVLYASLGSDLSDAFDEGQHSLLKLHGDAANKHTRVLSRTEYLRHYADMPGGEPGPLVEALRTLISRGILLFLGCSLSDDRHLQVLRSTVKGTDLRHYAILPEPKSKRGSANNDAEVDERTRQLDEWHIDPIWYPTGEHGNVRTILEYLSSSLGRKPVANCCPDHRAPDKPWRVDLELDISNPIDLLSYFEQLRTAQDNRFADAPEVFRLFRPYNIRGGPTKFEVSMTSGQLVLTTNPACTLGGDYIKHPVVLSPNPEVLTYCFQPRGNAGNKVFVSYDKPGVLSLVEGDEKSLHTIAIKFESHA